jgi:hypothetical protein
MLASRIFVVPITSVSPSTMRGTPEITAAACAAEAINASSKTAAQSMGEHKCLMDARMCDLAAWSVVPGGSIRLERQFGRNTVATFEWASLVPTQNPYLLEQITGATTADVINHSPPSFWKPADSLGTSASCRVRKPRTPAMSPR